MKDLVIGGKKFTSRFFLGTGKFASKEQLKQALVFLDGFINRQNE